MNGTEEGASGIDLGALGDALKTSGGISSESGRREAVAKVAAGAMLDIAASLRILALESSLAMAELVDLEDDGEPDIDEGGDFLVIGDLVRCLDEDGAARIVVGVGVTEDELYADVALDGEGDVRRAWQRDLERVPGATVNLPPAPIEPEPESEDDADLEDDFDPPATALDALREAEKKPAKKKGKKS